MQFVRLTHTRYTPVYQHAKLHFYRIRIHYSVYKQPIMMHYNQNALQSFGPPHFSSGSLYPVLHIKKMKKNFGANSELVWESLIIHAYNESRTIVFSNQSWRKVLLLILMCKLWFEKGLQIGANKWPYILIFKTSSNLYSKNKSHSLHVWWNVSKVQVIHIKYTISFQLPAQCG